MSKADISVFLGSAGPYLSSSVLFGLLNGLPSVTRYKSSDQDTVCSSYSFLSDYTDQKKKKEEKKLSWLLARPDSAIWCNDSYKQDAFDLDLITTRYTTDVIRGHDPQDSLEIRVSV